MGILLSFGNGLLAAPSATKLTLAQKRELISKHYIEEAGRYNWYYRLIFLATSRLNQAKIFKKCGEDCDQKKIKHAIRNQTRDIAKVSGSVATYSVALSCIVFSAYAGSKLNKFLAARNKITAAQRDFIQVFIPIITGLGVFSVGAPLWDPVRSFIRRWAFSSNQLSEEDDAFSGKYPARPDLEKFWFQMQKYFSVNAQMSRNTLSAFLVLITPSLQDAAEAYTEQRLDYAATQFAKIMVQMRFLYSEITPANPILAVSIKSYIRGLEIEHEFLDKILAISDELDPLKETESGYNYYVLCLRSWFDPDYEPSAHFREDSDL